ncbi:response regulator receiver protein [Parvibaculum lavamentivorans DS-1]|uniref:Response regulator receiver protein n=1 Tax=Parvibaculum lavamentivorans (strain DS-1 / DSM 13023 / NCIMB 13966) TaxID=402881 RepID=A7HUQ4_PARL1|nr:response regulator [Parvibaculum lavamentivorans]ABS63637.1 response regulator receiver protein [Parvibaculum lavamentivorans DS-1]
MIVEKLNRRRTFKMNVLWWMTGLDGGSKGGAGGEKAPSPGLPLSGKTVLVVEDEFFVGLEIAQTLEAAGADVIGPARSVEEAEELLGGGTLDMAVLDVDLDGQYSFDLALALQQRGARVVFATAHADDSGLFRGPIAAIPRIGKPTTARALLRTLLPLS